MAFSIATPGTEPVLREPVEGRWYAGIDDHGHIGAICQYVGGEFECAAGVVDMGRYHHIEELPPRP